MSDADPTPDAAPFRGQPAQRVLRLPPYLFGHINNVLQAKRRAGDDVIDLGMGNPSDPPADLVVDKLIERPAIRAIMATANPTVF